MDAAEEKRIARKIFTARRSRQRFHPLRGADTPPSLVSAYRIQDEVDRLFQTEANAGPMGGHKIALTSRAIQELCGVDQPAYGTILAETIRSAPATIQLSAYARLGLEFEVAFEINHDVEPRGPAAETIHDRESIAEFVASAMPAFELIDDGNADYGDLDAASILTDRCWCGGVVLGTRATAWQSLDLAAAAGELLWNGEVIDRGLAGDAMGHPLEGLAWIANHLHSRGRRLREGDIVITGSALKTQFPKSGDEVLYRIAGLGEVSLKVED
ncbi:2-keto-4-pentenoate hydratase [Denitrobaculum tricleocarpae]|uniref:Fumarylacetoacetase-like C-terminal domain-containing protein n=1 Tax=Denitrobaculum tricleocarpae TaxID=2591009 RepID=A0A545TB26_9PROT|nr:fumarylacetoacetate hydrolase family protein [Denitrobaculum tricleocarpae]TQV74412.1 hypothetical protein FKG95_24335 [Denitrobaculum tricleocarpae]